MVCNEKYTDHRLATRDIGAPYVQVRTHPEHEAQVLAPLTGESKASFEDLAG